MSKKIFILSTIILIAFLLISNFALARELERELENEYPKIPLPVGTKIYNFSLNDIFDAIAGGGGPAHDIFKDRDPLSVLVLYFYTFAVVTVGIAAFGAIIVAGVKLLSSGANPAAQADAKGRLQAALLGIVILLGSWILLNTINPELTILHRPGEALGEIPEPTIDVGTVLEEDPFMVSLINLNTLRYGGIVIYENDDFTGKSETVLNDIENFDNSSFVGNNLSAIRIIGNCDVRLFADAGFGGASWLIDGPVQGSYQQLGFDNDAPSSLKFEERDCLGSSITIYKDEEYIRNSMPVIYTDLNLEGDLLRPWGSANDEIDSVKFARPDLGGFRVNLCEHKELRGVCSVIQESSSAVISSLHDKISSVSLGGSDNRQAGMILYRGKDYASVSEVFIESDYDLSSNMLSQNVLPPSSLKIIGKYRVTLTDVPIPDPDNPDFDNSLVIDNSTGTPTFSQLPDGMTVSDFYSGGVISIPDLSLFAHPDGNWDERIKAILMTTEAQE